MKIYNNNETVLEAARNRMSFLFDNFEEINVSVSSGKDSTVLYHLALSEAIKRNRKIKYILKSKIYYRIYFKKNYEI